MVLLFTFKLVSNADLANLKDNQCLDYRGQITVLPRHLSHHSPPSQDH